MIRASVCFDPALDAPQAQHEQALRLLQDALAAGFGVRLAESGLVRNSFGRPSLADHPELQVSLSHCAGAAVAAVSGESRIGVDIERVRRRDLFAMGRMLSHKEIDRIARSREPDLDFFRLWTLKESYVKALGVGLSYAVRKLEVSLAGDGTARVSRSRARLWIEEPVEGYVLAFCCLGGGPDDAVVALDRAELTRL